MINEFVTMNKSQQLAAAVLKRLVLHGAANKMCTGGYMYSIRLIMTDQIVIVGH